MQTALGTCLIQCRNYREAECCLAEARSVLEAIAAKDAARAADVLRPSVLRAEAVAFAGLTDFDKAIGRLQELSEQRALLWMRPTTRTSRCCSSLSARMISTGYM